mmetsp:Transcript_27808/g.77766  ORF Transcript_27808/g.77766 Transcript_27808/m.77766 type:complete len:242 (+) Transcript_27808:446-1171(+)
MASYRPANAVIGSPGLRPDSGSSARSSSASSASSASSSAPGPSPPPPALSSSSGDSRPASSSSPSRPPSTDAEATVAPASEGSADAGWAAAWASSTSASASASACALEEARKWDSTARSTSMKAVTGRPSTARTMSPSFSASAAWERDRRLFTVSTCLLSGSSAASLAIHASSRPKALALDSSVPSSSAPSVGTSSAPSALPSSPPDLPLSPRTKASAHSVKTLAGSPAQNSCSSPFLGSL